MQLAHQNVTQPKLRAIRPQVCLWLTMPAKAKASRKLMPSAFVIRKTSSTDSCNPLLETSSMLNMLGLKASTQRGLSKRCLDFFHFCFFFLDLYVINYFLLCCQEDSLQRHSRKEGSHFFRTPNARSFKNYFNIYIYIYIYIYILKEFEWKK